MSTIAAGTTSGTALVSTGNTSGELQLQVNGTTPSVTLAANGSIGVGSTPGYGTNGQVLTSSGTGSAPTWTTLASGLAAATQAEMEAASSNTVAATPSNTNFHPGVAKAWINGSVTGTINSSLNIASITDDGVGECTISIATDFSSVNYVVAIGITSGGTKSVITPNLNVAYFTGLCTTFANVSSDPDKWLFVCYGDQA
jgi:hypothetical protein